MLPMSESGETPGEQAKRLRIALADQDAMLAQAAEMGQAVVAENDGEKSSLIMALCPSMKSARWQKAGRAMMTAWR